MRLLLDTHAFVWWDSQPSALSATAALLMNDPQNTILLSVASIWEMQIKIQTGKLTSTRPLPDVISDHQQRNRVQLLPVDSAHVYALDSLPSVHRDPFDRMLIAQANVENATLLSNDAMIAKYPVTLIW